MRNIIVHDSLSVDMDIVWQAAARDFAPPKQQLQSILKDLGGRS